jgi:hypothetical protein
MGFLFAQVYRLSYFDTVGVRTLKATAFHPKPKNLDNFGPCAVLQESYLPIRPGSTPNDWAI